MNLDEANVQVKREKKILLICNHIWKQPDSGSSHSSLTAISIHNVTVA